MTSIERILDIMTQRGMRQVDLATLLNVQPSTVNNWTQNKDTTDLPSKYVVKVCSFFEITPTFLFTGADDFAIRPIEDIEALENPIRLSEEEAFVVDAMREVDFVGRARIVTSASDILQQFRDKLSNREESQSTSA